MKKIQRENSKAYCVFLVIALGLVFAIAVFLRYYALEPVQLKNGTMHPRHKEQSILWMCKLPWCIENVKSNESVWAKNKSEETFVRKIIAMPGDTLHIRENDRVKSNSLEFVWKNENVFIEPRKIYIPKKGDTLFFNRLSDVEEDYALALLNPSEYFVKTSLWQGEREISLEYIGQTKLGNRQVSLQEVNFLPWSDRYLIALQIQQSEPGNAPIRIKREIFSTADSTLLEYFIVKENCYFLACERGSHCADSREMGYFTQSKIIGKYLKPPTKIETIIELSKGIAHSIYRKLKSYYQFVKTKINDFRKPPQKEKIEEVKN